MNIQLAKVYKESRHRINQLSDLKLTVQDYQALERQGTVLRGASWRADLFQAAIS